MFFHENNFVFKNGKQLCALCMVTPSVAIKLHKGQRWSFITCTANTHTHTHSNSLPHSVHRKHLGKVHCITVISNSKNSNSENDACSKLIKWTFSRRGLQFVCTLWIHTFQIGNTNDKITSIFPGKCEENCPARYLSRILCHSMKYWRNKYHLVTWKTCNVSIVFVFHSTDSTKWMQMIVMLSNQSIQLFAIGTGSQFFWFLWNLVFVKCNNFCAAPLAWL